MSASPIIKWAGGKARLLPDLVSRMPKRYGRYYEPFAGGLAMFLHLGPQPSVIGDANEALVSMYRVVAFRADELISLLEQARASHCKDFYYQTRENWNAHAYATDPVARAAAFIYMNKTCFNGLWRVNRSGEFNVPMGDYKNPRIFDAEELHAAAGQLRWAEIRHGDYRATLADAVAGDFVYLDPPYAPVAKTSDFTSYTADGFGRAQQTELADTIRSLAARGVQVMVSNSDTPLTRDLYAGLHIDTVRCPRAINSKGSGRGEVNELIICAGYAPAASRAA